MSTQDSQFRSEIRLLIQAGLIIFIFTVAVGILNGLDLVDFERPMLMAHVHAGTLGWITLGFLAACLWLFPDRRTLTGWQASAPRWLVVLAARAAREGRSADEVVARANAAIPRLRLLAILDTLEYLRRGGRVSLPQAFLGTLLDIKPILEVRDGGIHPLEKARTRKRAVERVVELSEQMAPFDELAVLHTHAPALGEEVRHKLAALHPADRILIAEAGPILGTHVGPGGVGIAGVVAEETTADHGPQTAD